MQVFPLCRSTLRMRLRHSIPFLLALVFSVESQAQLFADNDARREIIELRNRVTQLESQNKALSDKEVALTARLEGMSKAQLEVLGLVEALRSELAKLRGSQEELAHLTRQSEGRGKDLFLSLEAQLQQIDQRLVVLEPQAFSVDGQVMMVSASEKSAFQAAQSLMQAGAIDAASAAFAEYLQRFPRSDLRSWALYFLGSSDYLLKQHPSAISSLTSLRSEFPRHPRMPEALLTLAASQAESKQISAARTTLSAIQKDYPGTPAAQTAGSRLKALSADGK